MDRFTPIAVVVTLLMDVSLNSLLEPVSAHISVVILLTCLQVGPVTLAYKAGVRLDTCMLIESNI